MSYCRVQLLTNSSKYTKINYSGHNSTESYSILVFCQKYCLFQMNCDRCLNITNQNFKEKMSFQSHHFNWDTRSFLYNKFNNV